MLLIIYLYLPNKIFYFLEKTINYTGDPLEDLTLIRFLDRYVFKNPKKLEDKKVQKKNDPLAQRGSYVPKGIRSLPVDSIAYLNEAEERIPVDELFLYRYLKRKNESTNMYNEKDSDNESVNSEEFNEMLDRFSIKKDLDDLDIAAAIGTIQNKKGNGVKFIYGIIYFYLLTFVYSSQMVT